MMERPDPVHQAAPNPSIAQGRKPYNPVKRVGAFSEVQAEKAALVEGCAPTLCGKITLHKEPHPLSRDGYRGGLSPAMVFPPLPTPRRMARGYLRQTPCSRRHRPAGSPQTGAGIGRVSRSAQLGIAVNTIESAVWEAAYHALGMAHSGKRNCAQRLRRDLIGRD